MSPEELHLTIYGNPVLRERSETVTEFGSVLRPLIERMFEVMYEEGGVGLAAPQVGVGQRIMVLDVPLDDENNHVGVLINPEIVEFNGTQTGPEGCLSIPGLQEEVTRHEFLRVRGVDADGRPVEFTCNELLSRAIQHEVDHLNGVLFVDRLSPVRRKLLAKKLKKIAEEQQEAEA
jgi:peptide deformylase